MKGWHNEPMRHSLAAHGISTIHRVEFQRQSKSIQEKVIDKFMGPLMYRDREWFIEDLENTARNLSRQEFIDSYMEAAEEHNIDITPEELSLLYTFLRGGEPYTEYGPEIRFPERGVVWPYTITWFSPEYDESIENLSPESDIKLYHGTDIKDALNFVKHGIDLDVPPSREIHPEIIVSEKGNVRIREPGVYVSPNPRTSDFFGRVTLEFDVKAKFLEPPNVHRKGEMMIFGVEDPDERMRDIYPNSFNPMLSHYLTLVGEPQAFLKRSLSPEDIISVSVYDYSTRWRDKYTPKEFLETYGGVS